MTLYACDLIKLPQYHIHDLEIKNKKCCVIFYYVQELLSSTTVAEYSINKPCPVNEKREELNKISCVRERYREREKERDFYNTRNCPSNCIFLCFMLQIE